MADGGLQIEFPLLADEPVSVYRAEIGFWIGDAALLAGQTRMVSVVAAAQSRLLKLPARAVEKLLAERPEYWRAFYQLSARNVMTAVTLLSEALSLTVRGRVCRRLLTLSNGGEEVSITQNDLAHILGVARPTLRRCLVDLVEEGGIEIQYGKVCILDRAVLEAHRDEQ